MLTIPIVYNDDTRMISVSEEWGGTVIDDRSTMFSVSGIPDDVISAKLDVKVAVRSSKNKTVRPFLILKGIESGTGTATVPSELFYACKKDLKFIFQLELMTDEETYASANWITLKVSPTIVTRPSQMDQWNQDQVLIDCYEVDNTKLVFKRFSGDEFSILLNDNPVEWESIQNVPWRSEWSEGAPSDDEILVESLVKGEIDRLDEAVTELDAKKTDVLAAIPEWDETVEYALRSAVLYRNQLYQSKIEDNIGHNPYYDQEEEYWARVSSAGVGKAYTATIGDGTTTSFNLQHDLKSEFIIVSLIDNGTGLITGANVTRVDLNNIRIDFTNPPATNGIDVVVSLGAGGGGGDDKLDVPGCVPGTSQVYNLPYFFYMQNDADGNIEVHAKTITLDNRETQGDYKLTIPVINEAEINSFFTDW